MVCDTGRACQESGIQEGIHAFMTEHPGAGKRHRSTRASESRAESAEEGEGAGIRLDVAPQLGRDEGRPEMISRQDSRLEREDGGGARTPESRVAYANEGGAGKNVRLELPALRGEELVAELSAEEGRIAGVEGVRASQVHPRGESVAQSAAQAGAVAHAQEARD